MHFILIHVVKGQIMATSCGFLSGKRRCGAPSFCSPIPVATTAPKAVFTDCKAGSGSWHCTPKGDMTWLVEDIAMTLTRTGYMKPVNWERPFKTFHCGAHALQYLCRHCVSLCLMQIGHHQYYTCLYIVPTVACVQYQLE